MGIVERDFVFVGVEGEFGVGVVLCDFCGKEGAEADCGFDGASHFILLCWIKAMHSVK